MENASTTKRNEAFLIICMCMMFGMMAHGYRLFNNLYTHDALLDIVEDNIQYQRSLGRFAQTLSIFMRGSLCAPWVIGLVGFAFISVAAVLLIDIFEIQGGIAKVLVAGLMVCNVVITTSAAAFIPWLDVYGEAMFFSVLAAWLICRNKWWGYVGGCVSLVLSLGLYQAYVDVTLVVLLIVFLKRFRKEDTNKAVFLCIVKSGITLICSAVIYFVTYKFICIVHHVEIIDSYNSLSRLNDFSGVSLREIILSAYRNFFVFFLRPEGTIYAKIGSHTNVWQFIVTIISVATIILIVLGTLILTIRKRKISKIIIEIIGLFLVPIFANAVCVISKGMEHVLMEFSFVLVYAWAISLWEECVELIGGNKAIICRNITVCTLAICVWNNVVFSNQIYYRMDVQEKAFESFVSRMIADIEHTSGYDYTKTRVLFCGNFEESPYIRSLPYFSEVSVLGVGKTPVTYAGTFDSYMTYIVNANMNYEFDSSIDDDYYLMPCYPNEGSIIKKEETVVVKISN